MPAWICVTCGVQHADTERPPMRCAICEDERQYVGANGQQWTTMTELSRDHAVVLRDEEPNLVGVGVDSAVCHRAAGAAGLHAGWQRAVGLRLPARRRRPGANRPTGRDLGDLHVAPALLRSPRRLRRRLRRPYPHPAGRRRLDPTAVPSSRTVPRAGRTCSRTHAGPYRRTFRRRRGAALARRNPTGAVPC